MRKFGLMLVVCLSLLASLGSAQLIGGGGTTTPVCTPGQSECVSGNEYRVCNDQGQWNETQACLIGTTCRTDHCEMFTAPVCTPDAKECVGDASYHVCDSYGQWGAAQDCDYLQICSNGECVAKPMTCTPGDQVCVSSTSHKGCLPNGEWGLITDCPTGQYCQGAGVCASPSPVCTPNARTCVDNRNFRVCGNDGQWGSPLSCGSGTSCQDGQCAAWPSDQCTPGDTRCSPSDRHTQQTCTGDRQWTDWHYCQYTCYSGACTDCVPGDTNCVGSTSMRTCGSNGAWRSPVSCELGYNCRNGACQIPAAACNFGATRCSPTLVGMLQGCNEDLQWQDAQQCSVGCSDGKCTICTPGTKVCANASAIRACGNDGQFSNPAACPSNTLCSDGTCVATPATCAEGAQKCVSDNVYTCQSDNWALTYHCPSDTDCVDNAGTVSCAAEGCQKYSDWQTIGAKTATETNGAGQTRPCTNTTLSRACLNADGTLDNSQAQLSYSYECGPWAAPTPAPPVTPTPAPTNWPELLLMAGAALVIIAGVGFGIAWLMNRKK